MYYLLVTLMVLDGLLLATVVLLQAGQGGGLASFGGGTTDLVVGGRQAANLLTRMSWICGGVFMALALIISLISPSRGTGSSDVLDRIRQNTAPSTVPSSLPIEGIQQQPAPAPAPAQNAAPAQTTPPPAGNTPGPEKPN
jgi:preprotein translocase subunit SecG